ncbi:SurA N-terminal domain-containing protein [Granulosicoccaceae sp. 1_MG-2023]|nr:SurA N-terminal domain-containing protein [Granulosicoccaceae sp. 1_MG-2023]
MLTNMRESIKNSKVIKFVLLIFICAPFAFFGINSYFSGGANAFAIKVNDEEISVRAFDEEVNAQRNRLRQAFGGTIPQGFASEDMLKQQAIETLVVGQVMNDVIDEQNIRVSDVALAKAITETPVFQVDGKFDKARYEAQLRSAGFTVESFEQQFRRDVAMQDFRGSVAASNFVLDSEATRVNVLNSQVRNATVVRLSLEDELAETEVTVEEISAYFEENKARYMHPERVKIAYLELDSATLQDILEPSEDELRTYFDENKSNYVVAEERSASHILISIDGDTDEAAALAKAQELKQQLDEGGDFAALAQANSDDPGSASNGGSLGFFAKGAMVPEFEEAVFSMAAGDISEPVKSDFGYHIIRLDEIKPETGKSFDEVRDEIAALLKQQRADEAFYERSETLANLSFENPDSLVPAAEEMGLEIQESDWIDANTSEGIGADARILQAALNEDVRVEGNNSPVIELAPTHIVVLRTLDYNEPREKTLEEVSEQIADLLKNQKAREALIARADELRGNFVSGPLADDLPQGATLIEAKDYKRGETDPDPAIAATLFSLPRPATEEALSSGVASSGNGDQLVIWLNEVKEGEAEADDASLLSAQQAGAVEYNALVRSLRSKARVEINDAILSPAE